MKNHSTITTTHEQHFAIKSTKRYYTVNGCGEISEKLKISCTRCSVNTTCAESSMPDNSYGIEALELIRLSLIDEFTQTHPNHS